jgi:hypothetical protein
MRDLLLRRQMLFPTEPRGHPWLLFDSAALAIPLGCSESPKVSERFGAIRTSNPTPIAPSPEPVFESTGGLPFRKTR